MRSGQIQILQYHEIQVKNAKQMLTAPLPPPAKNPRAEKNASIFGNLLKCHVRILARGGHSFISITITTRKVISAR